MYHIIFIKDRVYTDIVLETQVSDRSSLAEVFEDLKSRHRPGRYAFVAERDGTIEVGKVLFAPRFGQSTYTLAKEVSCRCNCGYSCGGPGVCKVFSTDAAKCLSEHYARDCDHDFSGPPVENDRMYSVTCCHCHITAMDHDITKGP